MARSLLRRRGHLGFCHYERSEVIQKQVLIAKRLPRRAFCTARNDKVLGQEPWASVQTTCHGERPCVSRPSVSEQIASVTTFHRNDKNRMASFLAMTSR